MINYHISDFAAVVPKLCCRNIANREKTCPHFITQIPSKKHIKPLQPRNAFTQNLRIRYGQCMSFPFPKTDIHFCNFHHSRCHVSIACTCLGNKRALAKTFTGKLHFVEKKKKETQKSF